MERWRVGSEILDTILKIIKSIVVGLLNVQAKLGHDGADQLWGHDVAGRLGSLAIWTLPRPAFELI